jgi:hypothetical protein
VRDHDGLEGNQKCQRERSSRRQRRRTHLKVHIRVGGDEEPTVLEPPLQLDRDHFARELLQERARIYGCDLRRGVSLDVLKPEVRRDSVRTCDMRGGGGRSEN